MNTVANILFQCSLIQSLHAGIKDYKNDLNYGAYINTGARYFYNFFNSPLEALDALSKSLIKGTVTTDGLPIIVLYNHLNDCGMMMDQNLKNSKLFDHDLTQSILDCLDSRMEYKPDSVGYLVTVRSDIKVLGSVTDLLSTSDFETKELLCSELTNISSKLIEKRLSESVYYIFRLNNDNKTTVVLFQS